MIIGGALSFCWTLKEIVTLKLCCFPVWVICLCSSLTDLWHGWGVPSRVHAGRVGASKTANSPHSAGIRRRCFGLHSRKWGKLNPKDKPLPVKMWGQGMLSYKLDYWQSWHRWSPSPHEDTFFPWPPGCPHLPGFPPACLAVSAQLPLLSFPRVP